jgi:hypothetical protein
MTGILDNISFIGLYRFNIQTPKLRRGGCRGMTVLNGVDDNGQFFERQARRWAQRVMIFYVFLKQPGTQVY